MVISYDLKLQLLDRNVILAKSILLKGYFTETLLAKN
jgi:hypothetical protein